MTLTGTELDGVIHFEFEFATSLYKISTIERMSEHLANIYKQIVDYPDRFIEEFEMVTQEEKCFVLDVLNETKTDYPRLKTLTELFEEQVGRTPNYLAVSFCGEELTYMALNKQANQMARTLQDHGVTKGKIVGILLDRSLDMLVSILGILKAGGAYLPIDPENPEERIAYILKDSNAQLLLTEQAYAHLQGKIEVEGGLLFIHDLAIHEKMDTNLTSMNGADDLAYVMYTSGTTGMPKGIMTTHVNISRVVTCTNYIQVTER